MRLSSFNERPLSFRLVQRKFMPSECEYSDNDILVRLDQTFLAELSQSFGQTRPRSDCQSHRRIKVICVEGFLVQRDPSAEDRRDLLGGWWEPLFITSLPIIYHQSALKLMFITSPSSKYCNIRFVHCHAFINPSPHIFAMS
jgi:hypothetical protein